MSALRWEADIANTDVLKTFVGPAWLAQSQSKGLDTMTPHKAGMLQALTLVILGCVWTYRVHRYGASVILFTVAISGVGAAVSYRLAYNRQRDKATASGWNLERIEQKSRRRRF